MTNRIELIRGDSRTFLLTVRHKNKQLAVLTGAEIRFTAKKNLSDSTPAIQLKNTAAGGSSSEIEDFDLPHGQAKIHFSPSDTSSLASGRYVYDVEVILAGKPYTVILPTVIKIKKGVTE